MTKRKLKTIVIPWVVLRVRPSFRPVIFLKVLAFKMNLSPSKKFLSPGPTINLINPPVKNITPIDTIKLITLLEFCSR